MFPGTRGLGTVRERLADELGWFDIPGSRLGAEPHQVHPEVVRYLGWPAQAISYKLGERVWLAARDTARRRRGFDLERWHTAALALGPIGLGGLAEALRDRW